MAEEETDAAVKCASFGASGHGQPLAAMGSFDGRLMLIDLERPDEPVYSVQAHAGLLNGLDARGGQVGAGRFSCFRTRAAKPISGTSSLSTPSATTPTCSHLNVARWRWLLLVKTVGSRSGIRASRTAQWRPSNPALAAPQTPFQPVRLAAAMPLAASTPRRTGNLLRRGVWLSATRTMTPSAACWRGMTMATCASLTCGWACYAGRAARAQACAASRSVRSSGPTAGLSVLHMLQVATKLARHQPAPPPTPPHPTHTHTQFDRWDIPMNKLAASCMDSRLCLYDARTQHSKRGLACLSQRLDPGATLWTARFLPTNR